MIKKTEMPYMNNSQVNKADFEQNYDDSKLKDLYEVKRITKLLNLLSHENPFISE